MAVFQLHYNSLQIPPPVKFDQNTTNALDKTYTILDNRLSDEIIDIKEKKSEIKEEKSTSINDILTYIAFALTWINTAFIVMIIYMMKKLPKPWEDIELQNLPRIPRCEHSHQPLDEHDEHCEQGK